ncbi:amidohydrolase, partial [Streptomyces sp. NPDC059409]
PPGWDGAALVSRAAELARAAVAGAGVTRAHPTSTAARALDGVQRAERARRAERLQRAEKAGKGSARR